MVNESIKNQDRYLSYLLRLWRENGDERPLWRASLEKPQTEQRLHFTTLSDLFAFLEQETGTGSPDPPLAAECEHCVPEIGE